jgi:hypothetical protein
MSYGRLEINLLPPEFRPGPAVRAMPLINFALIAGTLMAIVVSVSSSLYSIALLKSQNKEYEAQIATQASTKKNYDTLMKIKDQVQQYGRIVSLASAEYVEVPVLLDRISRLLPDGVYLRDVGNRRGSRTTSGTIIRIGLTASRQDPQLLISTLNAFKADPIFADCYMSLAESKESPLGAVLTANGITWQASGPELNPQPMTDEIDFEVQARIQSPVTINGVPVAQDFSSYLTSIKFKEYTPPTEEERRGARRAGGNNPAAREAQSAAVPNAEGGAK